ncbi:MAG: ABC transporter permease [Clostridiales bacterium]
MSVLTIAWYTVIRTVRDYKSLFIMLVLPLILIIILGTALDSQFGVEDIDQSKVIYVNNDKSEISEEFTKLIKGENSSEIKSLLKIKDLDDLDAAKDLLKKGKTDFVIEIGKDYSTNVMNGKKSSINIFVKDEKSIGISTLQNIVNSFNSVGNTNVAVNGIANINHENFLNEEPISTKGTMPSAMDYYAVTMLVLIIMYGGLYAIYGFSEDYIEAMRNRLLSTPVSLWKHFMGKIFGVIFTIFLQIVTIIIFTKFIFNVNWGSKPIDLTLIAFTLATFSVALGMLITMIIKNKNQAVITLQVLIPIMTFASGGYAKLNFDSELISNIIFFIPSKLGQTAFFNLIYGDYSNQIFSSIGVIWIMICLMSIASVLFGRRKLV